MKPIQVCEIFGPTIQGEGALIGHPTVFVRTGGCDFRCAWCDSLYAVLPRYREEWTPLAPLDILEQVEKLSGGHPILVTLSGGNPALAPLQPLLEAGHARGHSFALETQGSAARPWFALLDHLVLSPKPPSSGMTFSFEALQECLNAAGPAAVSLKIVIFDEIDYQFARAISRLVPDRPMYLSVGNPAPQQEQPVDTKGLTQQLEWLMARTRQDGWFNVTLLPQLHVLLWGNRRGV